MTIALNIIIGMALYGTVQQLAWAGARSARPPVHVLAAILCLSVAGFAFAGVLAQRASVPASLVSAGRLMVAEGLLFWLTLTWLVAVFTRASSLAVPIVLSGAWGALLLANFIAPETLVYWNILPQSHPAAGTPFTQPAFYERISQAWLVTHAVIALSWAYALRAGLRLYRAGERWIAASWVIGLFVAAVATALDLMVTAGVTSTAYVLAFGLATLMVSMGVTLTPGCDPFASRRSDARRDTPEAATPAAIATYSVAPKPVLADAVGPEYLASPAASSALHLHWHSTPADGYGPDAAASPTPDAMPVDVTPRVDDTPAPQPDVQEADAAQAVAGGTESPTHAAPDRSPTPPPANTAHDVADLNTRIGRALRRVQPEVHAKGCAIDLHLTGESLRGSVNADLFEQIMEKLLRDAVDATAAVAAERRRPIVITSRRVDAGGMEITLSDGGAAISLAGIRKTFETLLAGRDAQGVMRLTTGTEVVVAHGGKFWYTPGPQGGSVLHLRFPA